MNKKVSIIVPIYKVELYLKKCVDSIINQTYSNIEVILVDDGSPDNSPSICDEYKKLNKNVIVIHQKNAGVSAARNAGIEAASGDFFVFVDADDFLEPTMIEKMLSVQNETKADIIIANYYIVKNDQTKVCVEKSIDDFCSTCDIKYLLNRSRFVERDNDFVIDGNVPCFLWRMMFSADVIKGKTFDTKVKMMEDVLFVLDVMNSSNPKIAHADYALYNYIIRNTSAMRTKGKILESHLNFYKHLKQILTEPTYSEYLKLYEFTLYADCVTRAIVFNSGEDFSSIAPWSNAENYKISKKHTKNSALKVKNYLIYHKMYKLLRFVFKFNK